MRISDWSSDVCSSDLLFYLRIDIVHNSSLSTSSDHDGYLIDQPSPLFRYREIFTSAIMAPLLTMRARSPSHPRRMLDRRSGMPHPIVAPERSTRTRRPSRPQNAHRPPRHILQITRLPQA